jgi:cytochrome P450
MVTAFPEAFEILERPHDFVIAGTEPDESFPFRGKSVIDLDGEPNFARRRTLAPLFARRALERYEAEIFDVAIDRAIQERVRERDPVGVTRANLVELTRRILLQVMAVIVGLDRVDTPERISLLHEYEGRLGASVTVKWATRDRREVMEEGLEAKSAFVRDFYRPSAARRSRLVDQVRAGKLNRSEAPVDVITLTLLHASDEDPDLFVREAILLMAAGIGTSAGAITWAVSELEGWLDSHPQDRSKLADTEFLRKVSNEVLRLRPTFPAMLRVAVRDTELASGRPVRAGERFAMHNKLVNRDPAVFGPDADRFNPYREVPDGVKVYGLAFGTGPKVCLGRPLVTADKIRPSDIERSMVHILKAFYRCGMAVDDRRVPVLSRTDEDVYEVFPVRFDGVPVDGTGRPERGDVGASRRDRRVGQ